jgi:hypothetical protein
MATLELELKAVASRNMALSGAETEQRFALLKTLCERLRTECQSAYIVLESEFTASYFVHITSSGMGICGRIYVFAGLLAAELPGCQKIE